ncbi:molybdate transport system substrate-binding protein [Herbaspirillum sp. Sphag1AN]|uniref:molybdate ABC transporter substrate-binding protein n=1 Tax=unclassified Herbaspirillum TaxID=2624150 RepID=UPI0016087A0A|nr:MULTISPECIES: substrate-binding domain-containing protein [unclassified Herbaspirillum]MBB3211740.1 molybdate transport system substrate-binding protein [Herbaspirillum sp. Sphag1AN]MBB3244992.1 molybdate transport system substrate-binding protein [Herbaspirillum sp. Sphag64]
MRTMGIARWHCIARYLLLLLALVLTASTAITQANAAELRLWSAGAAQKAVAELVNRYEQQTGTTIVADYAPVGVLLQRLAAGGTPDVLIVTQDVMTEVEEHHWALAGSSAALGSVGIGLAVKAGAPLPDISTPEALRKSLLNARSLTYIDPRNGTSGKYFATVLEQLGIADQVRAKTILGQTGFVVEPVARGEIELGVQQITEILPVPGVTLVGPLPAGLQKLTTYAVTIGANVRDHAGAAQFIRFLQQEDARQVFRDKGFSVP